MSLTNSRLWVLQHFFPNRTQKVIDIYPKATNCSFNLTGTYAYCHGLGFLLFPDLFGIFLLYFFVPFQVFVCFPPILIDDEFQLFFISFPSLVFLGLSLPL